MQEHSLQVVEAETTQMAPAMEVYESAMAVESLKKQVQIIQAVMRSIMKNGEHFGVIPGCGDKPTLLKPGAEKLAMTFRFSPSYDVTRIDFPNGHREYQTICTLTHIPTGAVLGEGVGTCSTMEGKYRFRNAGRVCPKCGAEDAIIKGKTEYGGGWICYQKKGGCGAKFKDGDPAIENQHPGKVEHDNPADYYNTVMKMSKKRAMVDAVLTATAASDIFTQDLEEFPEAEQPKPKPQPQPRQQAKSQPPQTQKATPRQQQKAPVEEPSKAKKDALWAAMKLAGLSASQSVDFYEWANLKTDSDVDNFMAEFYDNLDRWYRGAGIPEEPPEQGQEG